MLCNKKRSNYSGQSQINRQFIPPIKRLHVADEKRGETILPASDWIIKWREILKPTAQRIHAKQNQTSTYYLNNKSTLFNEGDTQQSSTDKPVALELPIE